MISQARSKPEDTLGQTLNNQIPTKNLKHN